MAPTMNGLILVTVTSSRSHGYPPPRKRKQPCSRRCLRAFRPRQPNGAREPLEPDVADLGEGDPVGGSFSGDGCRHEHLSWAGIVSHPRRDVDGSPEVVGVPEDDRPGVDADPCFREASRGWLVYQVE